MSFEPIAIVGSGCVLPGAFSTEALWDIVCHKKNSLNDVPHDLWGISPDDILCSYADWVPGKIYSKVGGFIQGFESSLIDPMFAWTLAAARQALGETPIKNCGLILGNLSYPSAGLSQVYEQLFLSALNLTTLENQLETHLFNRFMSAGPAHWVAQQLALNKSVFTLDAACASSLYAIKLACDELQLGRADMMLAGGISASDSLFIYCGFSALNALSASGQSRPFAHDADGLVPCQGAAILCLKRLTDAVRDQNTIAAVIRGIGLSNDGKSAGFLVPHQEGQTRCVQAALRSAEVNPGQLSYIECHATGTKLGDQTEINTLLSVLDGDNTACALGSLKANIGHSITTSGAAGIIKVIESMQHSLIPGLPGDYKVMTLPESSRFFIPREAIPWEQKSKVALINSFGFGGNNAAVILESYQKNHEPMVSHTRFSPLRDVVLVGISVRHNQAKNTRELSRLMSTDSAIAADDELKQIQLNIKSSSFPPVDLQQALGQQLILLELFSEIMAEQPNLNREHTGVYIGFSVEPEICRYGLRERLGCLLNSLGMAVANEWLALAKNAIIAVMKSNDVIGKMPNIPANRLNAQFGLQGPGFTISAEELSGDKALRMAIDAIAKGELTTALVGAIEMSTDEVHRLAVAHYVTTRPTKQAAVVMLLKDKEQAVKEGDTILSLLSYADSSAQEITQTYFSNDSEHSPLNEKLGHVHTASGLLHIGAAALMQAQEATFQKGRWVPELNPDKNATILVHNQSFTGQKNSVRLETVSQTQIFYSPLSTPQMHTYAANTQTELLESVRKAHVTRTHTKAQFRLVILGDLSDIPDLHRQAILFLQSAPKGDHIVNHSIFYSDSPIEGEMAFVFTGAASAYPNMGQQLLLGFPHLKDKLKRNMRDQDRYCRWIYDPDSPQAELPFYQLVGSSYLCQLHAAVTLGLFGLYPEAAIGLSSGETNAYFALGAWENMDDLMDHIEQSQLYTQHLSQSYDAVKSHWGLDQDEVIIWENWRILAPVNQVKQSIEGLERVYLSIINTDDDCVISGDASVCQRVLDRLGTYPYHRVAHDLAVHCPVVEPFEKQWRSLHTRPTKAVNDVRFYSNYLAQWIHPNQENVANALTGQALQTIDFPKLILRAWQDGVRVFIEHGPKKSLTTAISSILKGKPHFSVHLDKPGDSFAHVFFVAAQLWSKGIPVQLDQFAYTPFEPSRYLMHYFDLFMPTISLPALPKNKAPNAETNALIEFFVQQLTETQCHYYQSASLSNTLFLNACTRLQESLVTAIDASSEASMPVYPGPKFTRSDLEILASGQISSVLGSVFQQQDFYTIQCRMPEPPLLLCDRVLGIEGQAGTLGKGTIWTETDVRYDSWYLHQNHMPAGIMIESGQADLLLISWMGIDFMNRGERAYRLLGCDLTYLGGLPKVGDTLRYEISIDEHAHQGDVRLFFFHYQCYVNDEIRLLVRNGQAGFFTKEELNNAVGVVWEPKTADYVLQPQMRYPDKKNITVKRRFSALDVQSYTEGNMRQCFGEGHALCDTHTRTPKTQSGRMSFIEEILDFDVSGGPAGRGYLKARRRAHADDWFLKGHFKNDPCMPGTLMAEATMQAMAFYMTALGLTLQRDGWRFEPVQGEEINFICRGQATPDSKEVIYEIFVDDLYYREGRPVLKAFVLGTVDGKKAFLGKHLSLQLTPDYPLSSMGSRLEEIRQVDRNYQGPLATLDGFPFNYESMIHCAWGKSSDAFSSQCPYYDSGLRHSPRLPGEPYHFITRAVFLDAEFGKAIPGSKVITEYEIEETAWYFRDNARATMPYAVLMEVALQPCGWLSTFTLNNNTKAKHELFFRNLDGKATQYAEITPKDGVLRVDCTLTKSSDLGDTIIVSHKVILSNKERVIYTVDTTFGFFLANVFSTQKGMSIQPLEQQNLNKKPNIMLNLHDKSTQFFNPTLGLPNSKLLMLDRINYFDRGYIRAERDVDASDWYFKAHFYADPVQPGSLGVEAMLQLLQAYLLLCHPDLKINAYVFEPIILGEMVEWHYRGQVVPHNNRIIFDADVIDERLEKDGSLVLWSKSRLWVDGIKIYQMDKLGIRLKKGIIE